jgi:hypothetical protein
MTGDEESDLLGLDAIVPQQCEQEAKGPSGVRMVID